MKKAYEVTYKEGNEFKTATVKGYSLIDALCKCCSNMNVCENLVSVNDISFERYHAINVASAISEADTWRDCEEECVELCRLAGMLTEWREAGIDTFESVLIEAAKKLNVVI